MADNAPDYVIKAAQIAAYDEKKKRKYNEEIMFERDYYSQMKTYTRLGHDAGLAEGKAELVSKAYASGKTVKDIADFHGMTEDEVEALLQV